MLQGETHDVYVEVKEEELIWTQGRQLHHEGVTRGKTLRREGVSLQKHRTPVFLESAGKREVWTGRAESSLVWTFVCVVHCLPLQLLLCTLIVHRRSSSRNTKWMKEYLLCARLCAKLLYPVPHWFSSNQLILQRLDKPRVMEVVYPKGETPIQYASESFPFCAVEWRITRWVTELE